MTENQRSVGGKIMETFPKWMEDDYRKIANKGPLSTLIFGHRFKSDQTLYEYLTEFFVSVCGLQKMQI